MSAILGATSIFGLDGTTSSLLGNAYQSSNLAPPPTGPLTAPDSPKSLEDSCGCSGGFNTKWLLGGAAVIGALMLLRK